MLWEEGLQDIVISIHTSNDLHDASDIKYFKITLTTTHYVIPTLLPHFGYLLNQYLSLTCQKLY